MQLVDPLSNPVCPQAMSHAGTHVPNKLKIDWEAVYKLESFRAWNAEGKLQSINESVHFHIIIGTFRRSDRSLRRRGTTRFTEGPTP